MTEQRSSNFLCQSKKNASRVACIAGGIAGIRDGVQAIPQRWRDELRGREILEPILEELLNLIVE